MLNGKQRSNHHTNSCPVCGSQNLLKVMELEQVPVLCNVLWKDRDDAISVPRGDIHLCFCNTCTHLFNSAFHPEKMVYNELYENSLVLSPLFQKYAHWLAGYLISRYDLHGKTIIEIGSGKGDFLRKLCDYGGNSGIGFDPAYNPIANEPHPSVRIIPEIYSEKYSDIPADLIISRHTLEHIADPSAFLFLLQSAIRRKNRTPVFVEVPNQVYMLSNVSIWDVIYEHYSYFSPESLARLFILNRFHICDLGEQYGGQYLSVDARPEELEDVPLDLPDVHGESLAIKAHEFNLKSRLKIETWMNNLARMNNEGDTAVIWGAGSKGINFLNLLSEQRVIEYVVDINPRKHSMYISGTGQQIVPPVFLKDYQPDIVIVMNPLYVDEIRRALDTLDIDVDLLFA